MLSLLPHAIVQDHFLIYFAVIHSWPAAMSSICIERVVCEGIALLPFALYDPVRPYVRICVTYLRYYSSLSVSHAVLSILSKGVYEHPSVKRIATESLYIDETCCYPLSLVPLLLKFWWSSSSITTKTGVMWLSPCCHTFRCCSLTVRTLCLR